MPKRNRGRSGTRKTNVPNYLGQTSTDTQTSLTNLGFVYIYNTTDTTTESDNLKIYSQSISSGQLYTLGSQVSVEYYVYVAPFFPPFFPFFPPYFPPFFPFFPPYFPPFFPFFPPYFFFPFFPPYFPPFFPFFPPRFAPVGPYFPACLDENTLVLTNEGMKPAKDIKVGDTLLTVDALGLSNQPNATPLEINVKNLNITNLRSTQVTNVIVSDKTDRVYFNENTEIQFTETHPIFVKRNNEYRVVEAGSVQEGDIIIIINISLLKEQINISEVITETVINKVEKKTLDVAKNVYTFSCDPYNWYFAGNILTHNK